MRNKLLSWKIVLYPHARISGGIDSVQASAQCLGYEFFCWNGVIHRAKDGGQTSMVVGDVG